MFSVASTREEIAWTGSGARTSAVGIEPDVALVVDVTHATDYPGALGTRVVVQAPGQIKLEGALTGL